MINSKSCTRCGGDLLLEDFLGEAEMVCLQCGNRSAVAHSEQPTHPLSLKRTRRREQKLAA